MNPSLKWDPHPTRLNFKEFVPIGKSLGRGGSIRINHDSSECRGESDSLIITHRPNGVIVGYCHRCGRGGTYKKFLERQLPKRVDGQFFKDVVHIPLTNSKDLSLPRDVTMAWSRWPIEAKMFFKKAYLTENDCDIYEFTYSHSLRKVVLPLYEETTKGKKLVGYQLRRIFKDDNSPKYTTRKNVKNYFKHIRQSKRVCCVVEDYLSGVRVGNHVSSLILFGTVLTHAAIKELMQYDTIIIFLDNDNNIVKKKQMEMKKELEAWFKQVVIIASDKQPKEYDYVTLRNLFEGFKPF